MTLEPLIAAAKQRARRRYLVVVFHRRQREDVGDVHALGDPNDRDGDLSALNGYPVTGIRARGSVVVLNAQRFLRNVSPPRKTITVPVP